MRTSLSTASYLTGSQVLSLNFAPDAPKAELTREGDDWVVPSEGGGLDNILSAVSNISSKLDRLPLDQIGQNLNTTLRSASGAMTSLQELAKNANSGLSPALGPAADHHHRAAGRRGARRAGVRLARQRLWQQLAIPA